MSKISPEGPSSPGVNIFVQGGFRGEQTALLMTSLWSSNSFFFEETD